MNFVQIESRLNYLEIYDRKVRNYFNPNKPSGRKHPYINDLTADYRIDSELYGLGSYWKPEVNVLADSPIDVKHTTIHPDNDLSRRSPEKSIKKVKFGKLRDLDLIHLESGVEKESYKGIFAHTKIAKQMSNYKPKILSLSPMAKTTQINHFFTPELCGEEHSLCSTKLSSVIEANLTSRSIPAKRKVANVVDTKEILNELTRISDQDSVIHTLPADILKELKPKVQSYNDILVKTDYKNFTLSLESSGECQIYFKDLSETDRPEVNVSGNIDEYGHLLYEGSRFIDLSTFIPWSKSYKHLKGHTLFMSVKVANQYIFKSYLLLDTQKSKNLFRARNEIKRYKIETDLNQQRAYLPYIHKNKETHLNQESPAKYGPSRLAYSRNISPIVNPLTTGLYNFKNKFSLFRVNAYPAHLSEYERLDSITPCTKPKHKTTGRMSEEVGINIKGNRLKIHSD